MSPSSPMTRPVPINPGAFDSVSTIALLDLPQRHDFGIGIGACSICGAPRCLNRGCKKTNRIICAECWPRYVWGRLACAPAECTESDIFLPFITVGISEFKPIPEATFLSTPPVSSDCCIDAADVNAKENPTFSTLHPALRDALKKAQVSRNEFIVDFDNPDIEAQSVSTDTTVAPDSNEGTEKMRTLHERPCDANTDVERNEDLDWEVGKEEAISLLDMPLDTIADVDCHPFDMGLDTIADLDCDPFDPIPIASGSDNTRGRRTKVRAPRDFEPSQDNEVKAEFDNSSKAWNAFADVVGRTQQKTVASLIEEPEPECQSDPKESELLTDLVALKAKLRSEQESERRAVEALAAMEEKERLAKQRLQRLEAMNRAKEDELNRSIATANDLIRTLKKEQRQKDQELRSMQEMQEVLLEDEAVSPGKALQGCIGPDWLCRSDDGDL